MRERHGATRLAAGLGALAVVMLLQGCERNPYQVTECVGGKPLVERVKDVAPPNC